MIVQLPSWLVKRSILILIILASILSSCLSTQNDRTIPTADVFNLYYTPALGFMRDSFASCISSVGTVAPSLHEQFTPSSKFQARDIIFTLGEADWDMTDYFVTHIGDENIVFIINGTNPNTIMEKVGLVEIYSGRQIHWQSEPKFEEDITLWIYPEESDLTVWLLHNFFTGFLLAPNSKIVPNSGAMLEEVSKEIGSIGYLPESWLEISDPELRNKIATIKLEETNKEEMSLPILAYLIKKPTGGIKDFLLCLQDIHTR